MSESKMPESIDQSSCTDIDAANDDVVDSDGLAVPDTEPTKDHTKDPELTKDRIKDYTNTAPPTLTVETSTPIAPDGGWGWFIVLGSFLVHLVMGGFERSNGVMYLQLLSKYDRTATETSWVLSIFSTLRLAVGPVASALCNKYSCRTVVILGAMISTLGIFISAYVPDLPYLYLTYGVLGGMFKDLLGSYDMSFYFGSIGIIAGGVTMAVGNTWLYRQKKKSLENKEIAA